MDIGCGGGLLCEPLKRLGANITGIDASLNNIEAAKLHAKGMDLDISYLHTSPENLKLQNKFDVILNMEIIEHVSNVDFFIENCSEKVEKNGLMFVSTINRNLKSYLFAIIGAEYVLGWLPRGTHQWSKFVKPSELAKLLLDNTLAVTVESGVRINPFNKNFSLSNNLNVNYMIAASAVKTQK